MARIREQCKGAGNQAPGELDRHERQGQREGDAQYRARRVGMIVTMVMRAIGIAFAMRLTRMAVPVRVMAMSFTGTVRMRVHASEDKSRMRHYKGCSPRAEVDPRRFRPDAQQSGHLERPYLRSAWPLASWMKPAGTACVEKPVAAVGGAQ